MTKWFGRIGLVSALAAGLALAAPLATARPAAADDHGWYPPYGQLPRQGHGQQWGG